MPIFLYIYFFSSRSPVFGTTRVRETSSETCRARAGQTTITKTAARAFEKSYDHTERIMKRCTKRLDGESPRAITRCIWYKSERATYLNVFFFSSVIRPRTGRLRSRPTTDVFLNVNSCEFETSILLLTAEAFGKAPAECRSLFCLQCLFCRFIIFSERVTRNKTYEIMFCEVRF